ncbi:hypothetical protein DBR17_11655 [Sphingomonas sp. HMWF008]|nr:hypothetical protein DBR17_11655 [Sphingomonas sp. HMWF008]
MSCAWACLASSATCNWSFAGGAQVGLLGRGLIPGRPDSQFSIGVAHGILSRGFRDSLRDAGEDASAGETGVEITYQDSLALFLTVQPDLQYIRRPYAGAGRRDTFVVGLRLIASFERH